MKGKSRGKLVVRVDSVDKSNLEISFNGQGNNLSPYSPCFLCSTSSFFYEIQRQIRNSPDFLLVYRSEVRSQDGVNPKYAKKAFKVGKLCGGDEMAGVRVVIKVESEG
jgi:hypothetical protein